MFCEVCGDLQHELNACDMVFNVGDRFLVFEPRLYRDDVIVENIKNTFQ